MPKVNFQTILLLIFGFGAVVGIIAFAMTRPVVNPYANLPELYMWGTLPESYFSHLRSSEDPHLRKIVYRYVRESDFDQVFANALADGAGPDVIVVPHDLVYKQRHRVFEIPFEIYPASTFAANFVPVAEVFQTSRGFYALPATFDPMVMFWNRAILSSNGIATPPSTWDGIRSFSERVSVHHGILDIERSAVALGEYSNVTHAKNLISLLLMQSGSRIVVRSGNSHVADFSQQSSELTLPPSEALNFYTEFSDYSKQVYSWNSSMPDSKTAFIAEDLAIYFGLASEEREIYLSNPNIALEVSRIPQVASSSIVMTTGDITGYSVVRNSDKRNQALETLYKLTSPEHAATLDAVTGLPSVVRGSLVEDVTSRSSSVFVQSALIGRTWLDPDNVETSRAFSELIDSVKSGRSSARDALLRLASQINNLFRN